MLSFRIFSREDLYAIHWGSVACMRALGSESKEMIVCALDFNLKLSFLTQR